MEQLTVGKAKLTWLNGGVTHLDGGAMFGVVPKPLWSRKYPANENNQIELRTDPILLQLDGKNYLIDSGIGTNKLTDKQIRNFGVTEESHVLQSLQQLGFTAKDIDAIIMTHLHYDHANGLTNRIGDGEVFSSAYPDIPIYVSEVEWEEMKNPNIRSANSYWKMNWEPIQDQVVTFKGELQITDELKMVHTGGHSDGHSIIIFEDGENCFIHMADIMATHAHQNNLWVMAYDDYPMTSIFQKQKWTAFGYERQAWYTFYHDAYVRAIRFDKEGNVIDELKRNR